MNCIAASVQYTYGMQLMSYIEQLRTEAALSTDAPVNYFTTERTLRRAFAQAGLPSSTYYRAKYGADLKFATAKQVSDIMQQWKTRGLSKHGSQPNASNRTVTPA